MSDYAATVRKHRRLAILRHLADCAEYTGNASILQDVLRGLGLPSTRDQVVTELAWLKEQGFVIYEDRAEFIVVTATARGVELARGIASHPDVQRPSPRA
jgi:reverse gyrase